MVWIVLSGMSKGVDSVKVCLDAGHANITPGKRTPDGVHESEQNYPIMFKVAEYLKLNGLEVCFTNTDINYDMSLRRRVEMEKNSKADIFVSIHKNACIGKWQTTAKGIESYVVFKGGRAEKLANCIHKHLIKDTKMKDRGVKTMELYVCKYTNAPAVLVELGFMDYKEEAKQMKDPVWHDRYAKAITKGICEYFGISVKFGVEKEDGYKEHWGEKYYQSLLKKGIEINDRRFDDVITRGEVFALLDRILNR